MFGRRQEPRLENWDGRTRSSRDGTSIWPRAWDRFVALRLSIVFVAAGTLVALLFLNSPPFPYRIGSVLPHDFRARVSFEVPNEAFAARHVDGAPSLSEDDTSPPVDRYVAGSILVPRGQRIDGPKFVLLMAEHRAYAQNLSFADHLARLTALILIVFLLAGLLCLYVARFQPALASSGRGIAGICVVVLVSVGCALVISRPPWDAAIIPLTVAALVLAIAYNPPFALLLSFCLAIVTSIGLGAGLPLMLTFSGGLAATVLLLREVRSRTRLVEVSVLAGIAYFTLTFATGLNADQPTRLFLVDGMRHFLWSLLAGFILCGSLPLVERAFGVMTDATLLELADGGHPLMQELVKRAPGTYTHSMTVATLAESAAEEIGANPLLCRVGSYFHDIGKMLKPHYFVENQTGENRHDQLEPALSTLVIMGHVKDGVALARQYRLPRPIIDFIQQHHGTTLVEYFYREALRIQEEMGHGESELEHAFRYPGPKPRSREAGVIMLADAVESASRSLPTPSPNTLRKLVHDMLMKRLLDGQFDESGLSMFELKQIEESLAKSLIAVFHARIRYHEPVREAG
jgi:putative nucleotidyltransferase with HDIG domain